MNVSLTPELEQFIAQKLATGRYRTATDVVREGLRLLEQREQRTSFQVDSPAELEEKLREGLASLRRGEGTGIHGKEQLRAFFEGIKAEGRKRLQKIMPDATP